MALFRSEKEFLAAAASGDAETVSKYLASSKKWLEAADKEGNRAIHFAARGGHMSVFTLLTKAGVSMQQHNDKSWSTPLLEATRNGHTALVRLMLDGENSHSVSTGVRGLSPLQAAISNNRQDILQMFLDQKKADLTAGDPPAVYYAVQNKKSAILDLLIAAGADPSVVRKQEVSDYDREYFGYSYSTKKITVLSSPLQAAANVNSTEMIAALLAAGSRKLPDERPLHTVAAHGNIEAATLLLQYEVQRLTDRDDKNKTPLHFAVEKNHLEMAQFLLAQGIDKSVVDKEQRTALSYAQQFAMREMIELLQGPLPPRKLVEVKKPEPMPVKEPVLIVSPVPAAAEKPALKPVQQPIVIEAPPYAQTEVWTLAGSHSLAHITVMPVLNKKLTELFNFSSRERISFSENLDTKTELMGPHQSFDTISEDALLKALSEFKRLGGKADEDHVFKHNLQKIQMKKPAPSGT